MKDFKERAKQLKRDLPAVFLALKHTGTPRCAKIMAGMTIAYALSPIDLIPDFIPVLGYLDDLIILPVMIAMTLRLIPQEIMAECQAKSEGLWEDGKPKKWWYALPIVGIWILLIGLIVRVVL